MCWWGISRWGISVNSIKLFDLKIKIKVNMLIILKERIKKKELKGEKKVY